jgi:hypothetical protein
LVCLHNLNLQQELKLIDRSVHPSPRAIPTSRRNDGKASITYRSRIKVPAGSNEIERCPRYDSCSGTFTITFQSNLEKDSELKLIISRHLVKFKISHRYLHLQLGPVRCREKRRLSVCIITPRNIQLSKNFTSFLTCVLTWIY